jgi:hypothetical protein
MSADEKRNRKNELERIKCMYVCMYACLRSESESATHSSPPQLKGVRVISACARVCVC